MILLINLNLNLYQLKVNSHFPNNPTNKFIMSIKVNYKRCKKKQKKKKKCFFLMHFGTIKTHKCITLTNMSPK